MEDKQTTTSDFRTEDDADSLAGRGWHGDPEGHAEAGRKGGQKVARDRDHMAQIGRKGGNTVSRNREHMAEIGRKGGQSRGTSTDRKQSASDQRSES